MNRGFSWLTLLVLAPLAGLAQPATLVWHRIAGGGGASQPAAWQVSGTIGQSVASSGGGTLAAGFWPLVFGPLPPLPATSLTVVSSVNPAGFKDSVGFTASITVQGMVAADATGTVEFLTNGVAAGAPAALSSGLASYTLATLPRGTNTLSAEYAGDVRYLGSTNHLLQVVTNHPPAASVMNVLRPAGLTVKLALSDLATNWNDADGDPVSLTAISPATSKGVTLFLLNVTTNANGAYVITNTAFIGYVNASNVNDQISYAIGDQHGGTTTGTVNLLVSTNALTGQTTGIVSSGETSVTLSFAGLPGYKYGVQRSTNLQTWADIWLTNAPAGGRFIYTDRYADLGGLAPAAAYYRLSWTP